MNVIFKASEVSQLGQASGFGFLDAPPLAGDTLITGVVDGGTALVEETLVVVLVESHPSAAECFVAQIEALLVGRKDLEVIEKADAKSLNRASGFTEITAALTAQAIGTNGLIQNLAVSEDGAEVGQGGEGEPLAVRVRLTEVKARKLVGGEFNSQKLAVPAFSSLEAAICGP